VSLADKFDGFLPRLDSAPAHGAVHVDSVSTKVPLGAIVVPDAQLLFTGDFKRSGVDLVLTKDDRELVLHDYFKGEKRAALASPDGAHLTGDIVSALTGHTQYAQAGGAADAPKMIGHVTKLTGSATAIRNGVAIVLNNGDNVYKGDVVQAGSDSTLGITFIDGTVFGLGANAKMVLNEMIYDPNGSNNSSLLSLVQGTISFVAGATAKHGDMKIDTPVATMGIRGTAVLVEIDFDVPGTGGAPPAKFQVLVEPDGTTGSYILFDKTTLNPIATVNQAGTQTIVNGQGTVSFLSSVQLSPDAQKIITDVFALKFTDNSNTNTKLTTNFTDSVVPFSFGLKFANGDPVTVTVLLANVPDPSAAQGGVGNPETHIPGPPTVATVNAAFTEQAGQSHSTSADTVTGQIRWVDVNVFDRPSGSASFDSFSYRDADNNDVTSALTAQQIAAIKAVEVPLAVVQDFGNTNHGSATWTYSLADGAFDFLAAGETLTLTYMARVDNNYEPSNETGFKTFTITISGTNDAPVVTSATPTAAITEALATTNSATPDLANGAITFTDPDLTDTHSVTITGVTASGVTTGLADHATIAGWLTLGALTDATNGTTGSRAWTFFAADDSFDYLANGETLTLAYTIEVDDHHGGVVSQPVTITITGSNDAPQLAADVSGTGNTGLHTIGELPDATGVSAIDSAGGHLAFTDVDLSDVHTVDQSAPSFAWIDRDGDPLTLTSTQQDALAAASHLALTLHDSSGTGAGTVDFTYSAADSSFDFLADGEALTVSYDITVTDNNNATSTRTVTVTITGSNDAPVAVADSDAGHIVEAGNDVNGNILDGVATTTGNVLANDTDVDITDTHHVVGVVSGTVSGLLSDDVGTSVTGTYGSLVLNDDGTWTYTLDNSNPATDALVEGQHASDVFSYTESDGHGGTSTTTLTIDVAGTNDAPIVDAGKGGTVADTDADDSFDSLTGHLSGHDVDTGETATLTYAALDTSDHAVNSAVTGHYGSLTVNGDGTYSYVPDASIINALSEGAYVDTFTVQTSDVHGTTGTATLSFNVMGANDTPTLADANAGTLTDTAIDDEFNDLTGQLAGADRDTGETGSLTYAVVDPSNHLTSSSVTGFYGSLTVNDDGTYTYVPDAAAINALGEGTYADTFTVQTSDIHGATATATFTVDVTGANDTPVILNEADPATQTIIASDPDHHAQLVAPVSGTLDVSDADIGDTLTGLVSADATVEYNGSSTLPVGVDVSSLISSGAISFDSVTSDGGTQTLHWTYNPSSPDLDFLQSGDTLTITYEAAVSDGTDNVGSQALTITLVGADTRQDMSTFDVVNGTSASETFRDVGNGVTMYGGGGSDSFVFNAGFGSAKIGDFNVANDTIEISQALFGSIADILAAAQPANSGHDTVITDAAHDSITLTGVTVAQLQASSFHLV
jgi:VCBS repeat-containing protein